MLQVNVAEAKTRLSELLDRLERGLEDVIVISRRNVVLAEIRAVAPRPARPRSITGRPGFCVPDSFFEPLPDAELDGFEGRG